MRVTAQALWPFAGIEAGMEPHDDRAPAPGGVDGRRGAAPAPAAANRRRRVASAAAGAVAAAFVAVNFATASDSSNCQGREFSLFFAAATTLVTLAPLAVHLCKVAMREVPTLLHMAGGILCRRLRSVLVLHPLLQRPLLPRRPRRCCAGTGLWDRHDGL